MAVKLLKIGRRYDQQLVRYFDSQCRPSILTALRSNRRFLFGYRMSDELTDLIN